MGQPATETPPAWLIERLQSRLLWINGLGGLSMKDGDNDPRSCVAGDIVVLMPDGCIEFHEPALALAA